LIQDLVFFSSWVALCADDSPNILYHGSGLRHLLFLVHLLDLPPQDLADGALGEGVDEFYDLGGLIGGQLFPAELNDLVRGEAFPGFDHPNIHRSRFFPIVINTATGLGEVKEDLLDLVRYLKASQWQIFLKIRFPNALPYIFSGLKISSTMCVVGAIMGEFIASDKELGYIIINSQFSLDTPAIFAALIVVSLIGFLLFGLVSLAESLLMPCYDPGKEKE